MTSITWNELAARGTLFDRSGIMPRPRRLHTDDGHRATVVRMRALQAQIHPQLPPSRMWGYDGSVPGPVLEVQAGRRVEVEFRNAIAGPIPYRHVVVDTAGGGSMNDPGAAFVSSSPEDLSEGANVTALGAWTTVHLHGAPTEPDSDGPPESVAAPGQSRCHSYEFPREQWSLTPHGGTPTRISAGAAPMYWYHDHAMGATRFNVYAGLAGVVLVRDPLESDLHLPTGRREEIPLVLMDRNLDTADGTSTGVLTGALLHKVETDVRECFAPVNLVNGLAWPRCPVTPRVHRLRLVNGANARVYRLHFFAGQGPNATPVPAAAIQQIGTDGGLLGRATDLPFGSLTLAPGERADVLIDFGLLAQQGVSRVLVANSAAAPYGGDPASGVTDPLAADEAAYRLIPEVMCFDIGPGTPRSGLGPAHTAIRAMPLDPQFRRVGSTHDDLPADHGHTLVALREENGMLYLHELLESSAADRMGMNLYETKVAGVRQGIRLTLPDRPGQSFVTVAKRFTDGTTTHVKLGAWHQFRVINLSPDTHPFHVHLTQLQAVNRRILDTGVRGGIVNTADEFDFVTLSPEDDHYLDTNEKGWKDTVRVNPGDRSPTDAIITAEQVVFAGCFARHAGRYVFHCHILEHEDRDMMRPFVVCPSELMALMPEMGHPH